MPTMWHLPLIEQIQDLHPASEGAIKDGLFRRPPLTIITVVVKGQDSPLNRTGVVLITICGIYIYPPEVRKNMETCRIGRILAELGHSYFQIMCLAVPIPLIKIQNYFDTDPVGPGKGNQLPYLDGINLLIIPDQATQKSAIRTHKIDWITNVSLTDGTNIMKTNPELQYKQGLLGYAYCLCPWVNNPKLPCSDLRVRQALFMAIDKNAIMNNLYGGKEKS